MKLLLIEVQPGSGKSTFAFEICNYDNPIKTA
jgi:adenylate kinase family enzyme